jgi:membrane protein
VAQVLGVHEDLEPFLLAFLEPLGPRAAEIADSITEFVDNISGGVLAAFSIALLLLSAVSMAQKVESSFNYVWRVDRPRNFARRFGEYLSVIIIGPLVMVIATGLIASLSSNMLVERLQRSESIAAWIARLGDALPYLLVIGAFIALYLLIPNTRVRFKPALIGGIAGGFAWTASGLAFAKLVVTSTRFEAIYSGFATVIILMLWLYLSWLILLLGLKLAFYVQNPFYLRYGHGTQAIDNTTRERLSLTVMLMVAQDFADPKQGWTADGLASSLLVPRHLLEPIVSRLMQQGMIAKTTEDRLVPGRDMRSIRLADIIDAVRGSHRGEVTLVDVRTASVEAIVDRIGSAIAEELGERTLADLADEADEGDETDSRGD